MSKTCRRHECFKKGTCHYKIFLGYLPLCRKEEINCRYRAILPFGRYEPEDVILP